MGSVAAILSSRAAAGRADPSTLVRKMLEAAPHRGVRLAVRVHGCCALGMSSMDDEGNLAPVVDGDLAVAYTGIFDNLKELAEELERRGLHAGDGTGKLLIGGFRVFGEEVVAKLRGVFAVLLTDGRRLVAFRDQVGFRSLFYRRDGNGVYGATEAKQVVAGSEILREPDLEVIERVFYDAHDNQTSAALKGVSRLPPATVLVADEKESRFRRYWDPLRLLERARLSDAEVRDRFEQLMTQAVSRSLTGHDIVSLSGGIDSPAVAAFAAPEHRRRTGRPIAALSTVYPDYPSVDEQRYIELIGKYLQIPVHLYEQSARPLDALAEWARVIDGPVTGISLPECADHYRRVHELGFRTILTGHLAEFVFDEREYLLGHLLSRGRLSTAWRHVKGQRSMGRPLSAIGRQLVAPFVPGPLTWAYRQLPSRHRAARIPDWLDARKVQEEAVRFRPPAGRRWGAEQVAALTRPELWLEADEICQARCGVSARRPWADVDLWEFFLSVPSEMKFAEVQRKGLVRRLLRGKLPDAVLDRTDKTLFDDLAMAQVDYPALRRWLSKPGHHISGVNYDLLRMHLERQDFKPIDVRWSTNLASIHAFLGES